MVKVGEFPTNIFYVAKEPEHNIYKMRKLGK